MQCRKESCNSDFEHYLNWNFAVTHERKSMPMYGAVLGDIIGSTYEWHNVKSEDFDLFPSGSTFTDDTVLSVAVAEKILNEDASRMNSNKSYAMWYKQYYKRYPNAGFGQMFSQWALSENLQIQRSYGNGAAMRVSAIGYAFESLSDILKEVKNSCHYTHHHPEAVRGAQAIAAAIFWARKDCDKEEIRGNLTKQFSYLLDFTLDEIRSDYVFDSRTSYTVPVALKAFLESVSYEDAIRKAISVGGDSDTIACMVGGIAQAYYKEIPQEIFDRGSSILDMGLKRVLNEFEDKYKVKR